MPVTRPRAQRQPLARSPWRTLVLALSWGLCAAGAAHAQSLQELYQAAHDYDATYLAARAALQASQYRLDQARGTKRPSVGLSVSASRSLSTTPSALGNQIVQEASQANSGGATLSASQDLYNQTTSVTITQAERAVEVARADVDAAEQDLILRVSQAYFDVLAAQDNLGTARASLAAISEQVASAKRNFEVGTATITDTREAQARFDLARFTQIQAENDLLTKRILLDQTVGRVQVAPRPLAVPVVVPPTEPANVDDWVARADSEHPAVRKARLALAIARLDTDKAKAANLPTVTLSGNYGRSRTLVDGAYASSPFNYGSSNVSTGVAVTLSLPIYAGMQIQNRIKETLVLEDQSQDNLENARRSVAQATRTLFYSVSSGAAQVNALEAAESSSQLALEATQLGFKVGVRVNIDVLNAQAQLYTTQAQLAKARYDLIMAGLKLRQASGRLNADDVSSVNALLIRRP